MLRWIVAAAAVLVLAPTAGARAEDEQWPAVDAQVPWEVALTGEGPEGGYVVYKRVPPGTRYATFRLEAELPAPPEQVARAARENLLDLDEGAENMRKTIVRDDGDVVIVHSYIDMPLFITDRDVVTRAVREHDAARGVWSLSWSAAPDAAPAPEDGVIRVQRSDGAWLFEPLEGGRTRVSYESHVEIAGALPAWLVNSMMGETVVSGFEGLCARLATLEGEGDDGG